MVIGNNGFIGERTKMFSQERIHIDSYSLMSWYFTFIDNNSHAIKWYLREHNAMNWKKGHDYKNCNTAKIRPFLLHKKCWIGFQIIILRRVTVGQSKVIGAGNVVSKYTKEFRLVAGNPATFIRNTEQ